MGSIAFYLNSILLGVGLAMDAFSVSLANGLNDPKMKKERMGLIAFTFAFYQFIMPLIGFICVHSFVTHFRKFEKYIPWIALILLLYIGGKMLLEGLSKKEEDEETAKTLTFRVLMIQGIATSIDALSVGFTISDYTYLEAFIACILIAVVTFIICVIGLILGKTLGTKLEKKAAILGGVILIFIGIEIFVKGVFLS